MGAASRARFCLCCFSLLGGAPLQCTLAGRVLRVHFTLHAFTPRCVRDFQSVWRVKVAATRASRPVSICGRVGLFGTLSKTEGKQFLAAFSFMQKNSLERVRALSDSCVGEFPVTLWRDATFACSNAFAGHRLGIDALANVSVLNIRDTEFNRRKRSKNTSPKKLFIL